MTHSSGIDRRLARASAARVAGALCIVSLAVLSGTTASTANASSKARASVYSFGLAGSAGKSDESVLEHTRPKRVSGIRGAVVQIAASNSDGYALTSSGTVWAWGLDNYGQLGNGRTETYSNVAVRVKFPAGVHVVRLANPGPFDGALAIDSTHRAWVWGLNASGDLCLDRISRALVPKRLSLTHVSLATGALNHSLLYARGSVYACGGNAAGQLGDGSTSSHAGPVRVTGLPSGVAVTALASSWEGSGALLSNGDYYDWGYNPAGQLGDGSTADSDAPVRVRLPGRVSEVFQGGSGPTNGQTLALLKDGRLWTWGANANGQLGDGSTANSDVPVQVKLPARVKVASINSGGYSSYVITSNGTLWDWGGNRNGQLGTGGSEARTELPRDTGLKFSQVAATSSNVAALRGS